MMQQSLIDNRFPFSLDDLKSWTIRRTDGTITKYELNADTKTAHQDTSARTVNSYSGYCAHLPKEDNCIGTFENRRFWIGNMSGARQTRDAFDFVIDGGDVLTLTKYGSYLEGDEELVEVLSPFVTAMPPTRVLKIDWDDRKAPLVAPEFWVELNKVIYGDIMTCCIGGHGRSGTAFVCLLLVNAPDYDALDAVTHIRAVHCPRAIESIDQHEYINSVAKYLGREQNATNASLITDYKAAFKASTKPTAIRTREELGWNK